MPEASLEVLRTCHAEAAVDAATAAQRVAEEAKDAAAEVAEAARLAKRGPWTLMSLPYKVMFVIAVVLLMAAFVFVPLLTYSQSHDNGLIITHQQNDTAQIVANQQVILKQLHELCEASNAHHPTGLQVTCTPTLGGP